MKLSCPECLATFEYHFPPNVKVILVRTFWADGLFSPNEETQTKDKAEELSRNLKIPVLYTLVKCPKCKRIISIFYILDKKNSDDFHINIDDYSAEI